jgi:hypothetical protein
MRASRVVSPWIDKLSAVLPIVACLFCPACLLTLSALLSPLGIRITIGERGEWAVLLFAVLALALVVRVALRASSRWPLALTGAAALLFGAARLWHLPEAVELSALALMPVASIWAQLARPAACCAQHAGSPCGGEGRPS